MRGRDLTVLKLGGSHAFALHLPNWIEGIAVHRGRIVVVPGGGPFADAIRAAQPKMGFDDGAAHRMALLAMEQYGCALASHSKRLSLVDSRAAINRALSARQVPVWLPTRMVLATEIPWSWDVTSDSLAAWLAGKIGASRLLLVKHGDALGKSVGIRELVTRGIVDKAFPRFLKASGMPTFVLGAADHAALADMTGRRVHGTRIEAC
jgi:5-(aminomethyl)-3-furanmethanol phosphate kinase